MPTVQVQTNHHIKCDFSFKKKKNLRFSSMDLLFLFHPVKQDSKTSNSPLRETSGGKSILLWFGLETSVCTGAKACATGTALHHSAQWFECRFKSAGSVRDTQGGRLALWTRETLDAFLPHFQTVLLVTHPPFLGLWNWTSLNVLCYFLCAELSANSLPPPVPPFSSSTSVDFAVFRWL